MNRKENSSDKCDLHIRKRCRSRCNHLNYQAPAPPSGGSPTKSSLFEILLALGVSRLRPVKNPTQCMAMTKKVSTSRRLWTSPCTIPEATQKRPEVELAFLENLSFGKLPNCWNDCFPTHTAESNNVENSPVCHDFDPAFYINLKTKGAKYCFPSVVATARETNTSSSTNGHIKQTYSRFSIHPFGHHAVTHYIR